MSPLSPPEIEPRSYDDFVARTETLLEGYTGWKPDPDDPGGALVRVFARMARRVAERLNRVLDRNFLAFLDLVGVEPLPPQPARVPLTFSPAAGARNDAVVPARTPVAAQLLEGETEPVVFETERELVVTRTTLEAVVVHDPAADRWDDRTADAAAGTAFRAFAAETPVTHRLHLSHGHAFGMEAPKTVRVRFGGAEAANASWNRQVKWSWRDPAGEHPLDLDAARSSASEVAFTTLPAVPASEMGGVEGAWITARLERLRKRGVQPSRVLAGGSWVQAGDPVFPFGHAQPTGIFDVSVPAEIALPGARMILEVEMDPAYPAPAADAGLELRWEVSVAGGRWVTVDVSDATGALARSGAIAFTAPAGWAPGNIARQPGMWLRATVVADGGGGSPPRVLRALTLGYDLPASRVTSVEVQAEVARTGMVPTAGAAGGAPLDLSTDFFPFGEKPALGGLFYLALPQLAGKAGASVTLRFTQNPFSLAAPAGYTPPILVWEFFDAAAARWQPFGQSGGDAAQPPGYGFEDGTESFTLTGEAHAVTFTAPALGEVEVNGRRDAWIRARIDAGDYGRDAYYTSTGTGDTATYTLVPATYRPPSVHALELDFHYASPWTAPDAAAVEAEGSPEPLPRPNGVLAGFAPFAPAADLRPSLYLGFRRAGDTVGFANRAVALYLGVAETAFGEYGARPAEPAALAWWYWNGSAWAQLGVRDESAALTRRGMVTFLGPADFATSRRFGRDAFWLRATVERGGWPHPPRLERVLLNTVWAEHAARVQGEVLGSGTGMPGQRARTLRAPVLAGERVEVREAERPSPAEMEELEREAGPDALAPAADGTGGVWVRWTRVHDFHGSGPAIRHFVLDRLTGEVIFGDGARGRVPPRARASLRAAYRTGGGPAGNRPAGNLTQLKTTVPYVDRVTNPEPAAGGAAAESLDSVRERGPRTLRHGGRAVTLADLEDLAVEASPQVAVARALAPDGEGEAGRVRVLVVPRGTAGRPVPSLELLERVEAYLAERIPATVELEVTGPEWAAVSVSVEVVPVTLDAASGLEPALQARLAAFLHPLTGGAAGEGWPFGRRPWRSDLYALVEGTPGVDHVRRLDVRVDPLPRTPYFVVWSGTHAVRVTGSTDA